MCDACVAPKAGQQITYETRPAPSRPVRVDSSAQLGTHAQFGPVQFHDWHSGHAYAEAHAARTMYFKAAPAEDISTTSRTGSADASSKSLKAITMKHLDAHNLP
jgi:hypothetical protein